MPHADLAATIEAAFENRDTVTYQTSGEIRDAVIEALNLLDSGQARVAEKAADGSWRVNQWLKKAVLLSFRLNDMVAIPGGPGGASWWDKVPSKFDGWSENRFREAGFRAVPGAIVRHSAFIGKNAILMPSVLRWNAEEIAPN
jgi:2,3,4,5-tetrahydropyridine-2-carboxylate N-succinyltransferase